MTHDPTKNEQRRGGIALTRAKNPGDQTLVHLGADTANG
jgi:hypothetical protein